MTDFNLSEKIVRRHNNKKYPYSEFHNCFLEKDVKEFIKRLKEEFCYTITHKENGNCSACEWIDKICGEELR